MKTLENVGSFDRAMRLLSVAILIGLVWARVFVGLAAVFAVTVSIALLVTVAVRFCPLYAAIGWNTGDRATKTR